MRDIVQEIESLSLSLPIRTITIIIATTPTTPTTTTTNWTLLSTNFQLMPNTIAKMNTWKYQKIILFSATFLRLVRLTSLGNFHLNVMINNLDDGLCAFNFAIVHFNIAMARCSLLDDCNIVEWFGLGNSKTVKLLPSSQILMMFVCKWLFSSPPNTTFTFCEWVSECVPSFGHITREIRV